MQSCEFVCTINVKDSTVNFRFMSDGIHHIAPHWKQNVDMDFESNMCEPLSELVRPEFRKDMMRTFKVPYIVEKLNGHSPFITTFDLTPAENLVFRKQVQYFWIDERKEEILCIQTDITVACEKQKHNERLLREVSTDPLTSLPNRRGIRTMLDTLAGRCDDFHEPFCVAMCDIDFFKKVNDTYGHDGGDMVLTTVSSLIQDFMKDKGSVGRMGGEEFLVAFNNCELPEAVKQLELLRQAIENLDTPYRGQTIKVTMTFGAVDYRPSEGVHDAITRADERLCFGKNNGRNRVVGGDA